MRSGCACAVHLMQQNGQISIFPDSLGGSFHSQHHIVVAEGTPGASFMERCSSTATGSRRGSLGASPQDEASPEQQESVQSSLAPPAEGGMPLHSSDRPLLQLKCPEDSSEPSLSVPSADKRVATHPSGSPPPKEASQNQIPPEAAASLATPHQGDAMQGGKVCGIGAVLNKYYADGHVFVQEVGLAPFLGSGALGMPMGACWWDVVGCRP